MKPLNYRELRIICNHWDVRITKLTASGDYPEMKQDKETLLKLESLRYDAYRQENEKPCSLGNKNCLLAPPGEYCTECKFWMKEKLIMTEKTVKWLGTVTTCDICELPIKEDFVDGKTRMGPWARMCPECFVLNGAGIGIGHGQAYHKQLNGEWHKVH